jgi:hypothetical protein
MEAASYNQEIGKMRKSLKGLCGVVALAGTVVVGSQMAAQAQCADCNRPVASTKTNTVYRYKTVQSVRNVTQYKDVNRTQYHKHVTRIVNVTRVQPVTRVNVVTRVHNRTVILRQTQNVAQTATLPTRTITTGKTIQINHAPVSRACNCR